jgi:Sulfotransferase family
MSDEQTVTAAMQPTMTIGRTASADNFFFNSDMASMVKQKVPSANSSYRILMVIAFLAFLVNVSHMIQLDESFQPVLNATNGPPSEILSAASDNTGKAVGQYFKPFPKRKEGVQHDLVKAGDYIYFDVEDWDTAPIIIESHRLVFFTIPKVGCTVWKQLFRRMMGCADWNSQDYETVLPHNPKVNGLKYLYHYDLKTASEIMTSPNWTRAMMVREPKKRFLSSFLDKAVSNDHIHIITACCKDKSCVAKAQDLQGFLRLCSTCSDAHWRAQNDRVDYKYWPYIDEIGHVETAAADAKKLLQRIGAWEEFGLTGWGHDGNQPIFGSKDADAAGIHSTYADWQVWKWYTPEIEQSVERFYQGDYDNPLFNFTRNICLTCTS